MGKKKKKFDHRKFLWRLLETLHDIHGSSCLGAVKKAIKIHQKCIFQPLHNKVNFFFGYQGIIFNRKKVLNFSQIESVRRGGGGDAPPPESVSLTDSSQFFFYDF